MSLADRSPDKSTGSTFSVRKLAIMAIFIAISVIAAVAAIVVAVFGTETGGKSVG